MKNWNELRLKEALQHYYSHSGIASDGGASEWFGRADFGPFTIYVPNFPARVETLKRHDLHHVLLGAETSMQGEAIVGSFETGAGCGKFWVSWFLEPQTIVYGLLLNPKQTFTSFCLGRRSKSFFQGPFREEWLEETVGQLRSQYLAQNNILPTVTDFLLFSFWAMIGLLELIISLAMVLSPFLILAFLIQYLIHEFIYK